MIIDLLQGFSMKVLLVSAECVPFAKVGGLADVVGSLPKALMEEGVDARVIMPGYGQINHQKFNINHQFTFQFQHHQGTTDVHVYMCIYDGVTFYFIQGYPFIGQESSVYTDWEWDAKRFIWFNQAVIATVLELNQRMSWMPDVINVSDWHTALIPFLVAESRWKQEWSKVATVLTIHNVAYMGNYLHQFLFDAGIPYRGHTLVDKYGLQDNLLGTAIAFTDKIVTVSPRYAMEIQHTWAGYELAGILTDRRFDLVGILNGIDTHLWNPETDRQLAQNFNADTFEQYRIANKRKLQEICGLPQRDRTPIIGVVSRLASQKGFDYALPAVRRLLVDTDAQFILLGTGEPDLEHQAWRLASDFGWRARAYLKYDGMISQLIYGGSDMFLMPSHYEPCGIGQMLAMRYGSLPIVRETGGLADTVQNYDNYEADYGTGFMFQWETGEAALGTMRWAVNTYHRNPDAWTRMQRRAMQTDFSWRLSAKQYIQVFTDASNKF
jgi:starch synthase